MMDTLTIAGHRLERLDTPVGPTWTIADRRLRPLIDFARRVARGEARYHDLDGRLARGEPIGHPEVAFAALAYNSDGTEPTWLSRDAQAPRWVVVTPDGCVETHAPVLLKVVAALKELQATQPGPWVFRPVPSAAEPAPDERGVVADLARRWRSLRAEEPDPSDASAFAAWLERRAAMEETFENTGLYGEIGLDHRINALRSWGEQDLLDVIAAVNARHDYLTSAARRALRPPPLASMLHRDAPVSIDLFFAAPPPVPALVALERALPSTGEALHGEVEVEVEGTRWRGAWRRERGTRPVLYAVQPNLGREP